MSYSITKNTKGLKGLVEKTRTKENEIGYFKTQKPAQKRRDLFFSRTKNDKSLVGVWMIRASIKIGTIVLKERVADV